MGVRPEDVRPRYLVHFADGGTGMRRFDDELEVDGEISDGANGRYRIVRVQQPGSVTGLGHAWAEPVVGAPGPVRVS